MNTERHLSPSMKEQRKQSRKGPLDGLMEVNVGSTRERKRTRTQPRIRPTRSSTQLMDFINQAGT